MGSSTILLKFLTSSALSLSSKVLYIKCPSLWFIKPPAKVEISFLIKVRPSPKQKSDLRFFNLIKFYFLAAMIVSATLLGTISYLKNSIVKEARPSVIERKPVM